MATLPLVLQILLVMVAVTAAIDFNWASSGRRGQRGKVATDSSRAGKRNGERRQAKTGGSEGEMICGGGANYECSSEECKVSCDDGTEGVLQCVNNVVSLSSNTIGGTTETKVFCTQGVASSGGSEDPAGAASSPQETENIIPDSPAGPANPPPKPSKPKRPTKPNKNKKPKRPSFPKFPSFPKCFWGTRDDGSCKQWKLSIE